MKDNIPFFSIILPTYNRAKELKKSIESVLSQTYENYELIIIDNYSIDDTDNVLKNISDSRIRIIKIHNEGIIAKSRNLGISISKGIYIAFLDSDDLWYNNKLEICYCTINKNNSDFLYHEMIINTNHFKLMKKNIGSIKYNKPVYLGDRLELQVEVTEVVESVGVVQFRFQFLNQTAVTVAKGKIQIGIL